MTPELAINLGRAVTYYFQKITLGTHPLIVVGKDTRLSCYMLELAFSSGVCSQGGKVILTGPFQLRPLVCHGKHEGYLQV